MPNTSSAEAHEVLSGQTMKFVASLLTGFPSLPPTILQNCIENPGRLSVLIRNAILSDPVTRFGRWCMLPEDTRRPVGLLSMDDRMWLNELLPMHYCRPGAWEDSENGAGIRTLLSRATFGKQFLVKVPLREIEMESLYELTVRTSWMTSFGFSTCPIETAGRVLLKFGPDKKWTQLAGETILICGEVQERSWMFEVREDGTPRLLIGPPGHLPQPTHIVFNVCS